MPILFGGLLFGGLLASFGVWFLNIIGTAVKKFPLVTAFFIISVSILTTYILAMHTLVNALSVTIPATVQQVWGWVMPSNSLLVLTSIYGAKIAKFYYVKSLQALKFKARSSINS